MVIWFFPFFELKIYTKYSPLSMFVYLIDPLPIPIILRLGLSILKRKNSFPSPSKEIWTLKIESMNNLNIFSFWVNDKGRISVYKGRII